MASGQKQQQHLPNVPRWTPSPPRRQARGDAHDEEDAESALGASSSMRSTDEASFPFGSGRARSFPFPLTQPSLEISVVAAANGTAGSGGGGADGPVAREKSLRRADEGVVVSWEDLWVSAAGGNKGGRVPILCGLNGYARPGEVLAIMGPSGCGKSTLLDALAGRLGSNVSQKGDILINGLRQKLAYGTSAYVTQEDVLMTTLTVREAVHYSAQLQLPSAMAAPAKRERAEETLREMGLEAAADTRIGGWMHKGISGGQRRRVSICMEILTRPALLFLDEPTSGLDSAASYHVVSRIARLARREGMTVVAAVHQPSTEVYGLFHGLCLLAYGRTVFFGAAAETNQFFALSGFPCPSLMNPSDHFLRTINKDFDKDIEEGLNGETKMTTAEAIDTLVNSYKASAYMEKVTRQIADTREAGGAVVKKEWQASFLTQSLVLTKRSFVNMYRDLGYYWLRFAIYIMLCLCVGTVFYDVGHSYGSILVSKKFVPSSLCLCSIRFGICVVLIPKKKNPALLCCAVLCSAGPWLPAQFRRRFPHLHGHRRLPVVRRGHEDLRAGEAERALRRGAVHDRQHGVRGAVPGAHLRGAGRHSLLPGRPPEQLRPLRLLRAGALHDHDGRRGAHDDRGQRRARLPHGHHHRRRHPGRHDAQRRLLPPPRRPAQARLALPHVLHRVPQVRQPGPVQERVPGPHLPQQPGGRQCHCRHPLRRPDLDGLLAGGDGVQQVGRPRHPVRDGRALQDALLGYSQAH
ncbi:ABC transporter G family member 12 isoform X1 [Zea mays]|uniref:ABC transporter domain-containing protein n=1 Tax=Zea mays TaxID=4577 RepID=A0A804QAB8_MAIZE|nr:ABC transporter G family member 12 isoform X1 [Zea mays]|eukprot:XP_020396957.1 ABC transporter G family member 12 isoform X1 [Zea mays]